MRRAAVDTSLTWGVAMFAAAGTVNAATPSCPLRVEYALGLGVGAAYVGLAVVWGVSVASRLLPGRTRAYAIASSASMAAWMLLRLYRYRAAAFVPDAARLAWYGYYPCQLGMAWLLLRACLARDGAPTSRASRAALVATATACALTALGVLTNDAHHLAFAFGADLSGASGSYARGPLFWAALSLTLALPAVGAAHLARAGGRRVSPRRSLVPALVLLALLAYVGLRQVVDIRSASGARVRLPYQDPEALCFAIALAWEWLIRGGLIPSNVAYRQFFAAMELPARIVDASGETAYETGATLRTADVQLRAALDGPVALDANTRLEGMPLRAGAVFWESDLSAINLLNAELAEAAELLAGENELMAAHTQLAERAARVATRTRVYDLAVGALDSRLAALRDEARKLRACDEVPRERLVWACVRLACAKRALNLRLVAAEHDRVDLAEVRLSVDEVLRQLRRASVACAVSAAEGGVRASAAVTAFEGFCDVLDRVGTGIGGLLARVDAHGLALVLEPATDAELAALPGSREEGGTRYLRLDFWQEDA